MTKQWFDIDKEGLGRILKRRGLEFIVFELISNAWDSKAQHVQVTLEPVPNKPQARLIVGDDDPEGFINPEHAYTMFADSLRRGNPTLRGRFNLGEKLALAISKEARIVTRKAGYRFDNSGRHRISDRTLLGSLVDLTFPCTREELKSIEQSVQNIIPPVHTTFNGVEISPRKPVSAFSASLDTVLPDEEGNLKKRQRKAVIEVYNHTTGWIYELGIPVVETGDKYSYNIMQKVPVNMERDNVPPAYLRTLRVLALNHLHDNLDSEDCNNTWVREALSDKRASNEAVSTAIKQRFGENAVIYDPSDREANSIAFSKGFTVISGNSLSKSEWENVKRADVVKPAGQVTPSPKPYKEGGNPLEIIPTTEWTKGMFDVVDYAHEFFKYITGHQIDIEIARGPFTWNYAATYGEGSPLILNLTKLGKKWFEQGITDDVVSLLIHEAGHEYESDHLSSKFHDALCKIGARLRNFEYKEFSK